MKKIILMVCLAFAFSQVSNAQIQFGVKGGVNYTMDSFTNIKDNVLSGAKNKAGFHIGTWVRAKLPGVGFYIRPELVYTQLSNDVIYDSESTNFKFQKIDIPVLFGKKVFGVGNVFVGPSFQYILGSAFGLADLTKVDSSGFSVGMQLGIGVEFSKFGIDLRYERSLSNVETLFRSVSNNADVNFDTRVNQIVLGLSYKFL